MKKLLLATIFFSILFFVSCGDDGNGTDPVIEPVLKLVKADTLKTGSTFSDEELISYAQLENSGDKDINVKAKMEVIQLPEGVQTAICVYMCYAYGREDFVAPDPLLIPANSLSGEHDFSAHYNYTMSSFPVAGTGKIKYTFWVEDNPSDSVSYVCTYIVQ